MAKFRADRFSEPSTGVVMTGRELTQAEITAANLEIELGTPREKVIERLALQVQAECDAFNERAGSQKLADSLED